MSRKQKLMLNSITSVMYQIITLICGFILPRLFLAYYGSAVNGLVASITQFLGFITLCECGVGAVVQSCLYIPLANQDELEISKIVISSEHFFKRIAYFLVIYTVLLMFGYPYIVGDSFGYFYTFSLIFVISISTFAQYYFGMTYKLLLNADQLGFIQLIIHSAALIMNVICCVVLLKCGVSIQIVKLTTSLIFLLQPLSMAYIAKRKYVIDRKLVLTEEPIKQKWNGLAQHIAAVILSNTDTVVLTMFSTLENVSIYSVYFLVVNGIKQMIVSFTNGFQALLGNMLAKKEKALIQNFSLVEWLIHTLSTVLYVITAILLVPFVVVYTKEIDDANYIVPLFGYLLVVGQAMICIRLPYFMMITAAGHYKQTQNSAIIEAVIKVVLSVLFVFKYGIVGVAIGTLVAVMYRTCYFVWYLSKSIINRNIGYFIKNLLVDLIYLVLVALSVKYLRLFSVSEIGTYFSWTLLAIKVAIVCTVEALAINILFYRNNLVMMTKLLTKRLVRK